MEQEYQPRFVDYVTDFMDQLEGHGGLDKHEMELAALRDITSMDLSHLPTNEAGERLISRSDFCDLLDAAIARRRGPAAQH